MFIVVLLIYRYSFKQRKVVTAPLKKMHAENNMQPSLFLVLVTRSLKGVLGSAPKTFFFRCSETIYNLGTLVETKMF